MTKSALPASQIREAVEARLGPVTDFEPLAEGLVSQVFAFGRDDEAYVVRVGAQRDGYEKDAFAARTFGRSGLPIPEIVLIDALNADLALCISRRASGKRIQSLDAAGAEAAAPAFLETLANIGEADIAAVTGWGRFDAVGRAPSPSWRAYLLRFDQDADAWISRLPAHAAVLLRRALTLVEQLSPSEEPERRLIHGDLGSPNLIADAARITAVIDWDLAAVGDALYDVAGLLFWNEAQLSTVCETLRRRYATERRTLLCYQLRTGVEEARQAAFGGVTFDVDWLLGRVRELLDEAAAL